MTMFQSTWLRWSALAGMLGGGAFVLALLGSTLLNDNAYPGPYSPVALLLSALILPALLLMIGGLAGLQARRLGGAGAPGAIAFTGALTGLILLFLGFGGQLIEMTGGAPVNGAWNLFITGLFGMVLGMAGFAAAGWRAGLLPRWNALPVLGGGLAAVAMLFFSIWGYDLMTEDQRTLLNVIALSGLVVFMAGWMMIHHRLWASAGHTRPGEVSRSDVVAG
jgi:hypothetical protein